MDLANQSTIHAPYSVINNTINKYNTPSSSTPKANPISEEEAQAREWVATNAIKSASFNAAERGDPPKCHPETRLVVQDSLAVWPDSPMSGPVRLISGWAGTGKTTVAQTMAEYWARQRRLAGSFFFSRSGGDRSNTIWFPETILWQFRQIYDILIAKITDSNMGYFGWHETVDILSSTFPLSPPMVIVIDGLDECSHADQVHFLTKLLDDVDRLDPSIKILISCRPERHLVDVFDKYADKLGPSYRIHLGQSAEDKDDIRTFLRVSFDRICQDRRRDRAMSIMDGPWPSEGQIEDLVNRASGQFIFAAIMLSFVGDEEEDPVKLLNLVLGRKTSSFQPIDALYLVILQRVIGTTSPHHHHLIHNLLFHINYEPSSSARIADFWFEEEVDINIRIRNLRALLVRRDAHDRDSQDLIQFRHKSFDDFLARPSAPHPFSLAAINPVSKFFFFFRKTAKKASQSLDFRRLKGTQRLGYALAHRDDHPLVFWPYEEEARLLHQKYVQNRPAFRGCICLPQLVPIVSNMRALRTVKPCGQDDCILDQRLLTLCRMMEMPVDHFTQEWSSQEHLRPISFHILECLLWLRVVLRSLFDPLPAIEGVIRALIFRPSSLSLSARCVAVVNVFLCMMVLVNTRCDVVLLLYGSHMAASLLLHQFLRFDTISWD